MGSLVMYSAEVSRDLIPVLMGLDQSTYYHCIRVQKLAMTIGQALGLGRQELATLRLGALLHDVGKQGIPAHILLKPGRLTAEEREVMEGHSTLGCDMTKQLDLDVKTQVQEIIQNHHLWYNGKGGYPRTNHGSRPSLLAQIASVADVIDAMMEDRPYRKGLSLQASLDFLLERSGSQFSPLVVQCASAVLTSVPVVAGF